MKSKVVTGIGILVLLGSGQPAGVWPAAAGEEAAGEGSTTNGLIFKKRTRRQYTSAVTINKPEGAVSAPVESEDDDRVMNSESKGESISVDRHSVRSMMQIAPGGPRKPLRAGKEKKKDEEDWLLTPQQRIQKEIDLISGKEEDEEDEDSYGWLADEVESIRDEKIKEQQRRQREEEEQEEAEEIAAIMGRDLFGSGAERRATGLMRDDRGRLLMPTGSDQRRGFGEDATNSVSAPTLRIRDEEGEERGMARRPVDEKRGTAAGIAKEDPHGGRTTAPAGEAGTLTRAGSGAKASQDAGSSDGRIQSAGQGGTAGDPPPVSTGIPSPFSWNSRSGGGYAGLPSSVAPSIMPAQGNSSAGTGSGGGWTLNPGGNASPAGTPSRLTGARYTYDLQTPRAGSGLRAQPGSPAGGAASGRTPFMSPMTPGLQGGAGYGTLPAQRP